MGAVRARLRAALAGFAVLVALAGCAATNDVRPDASPEEVARAAYHFDGPPSLTLFTMINNRSKAGAHTSLMINASQRVIFDPAGSVRFASVPERGDVLYGITPTVAEYYERAHARSTYHVVIQSVEVSPEVAEKALRLAVAHGGVGPARCTASTTGILKQLPGFEGIRSTFFPKTLMKQWAELPGVQTRTLYEDDSDDKSIAIAEFEKRLSSGQTQ